MGTDQANWRTWATLDDDYYLLCIVFLLEFGFAVARRCFILRRKTRFFLADIWLTTPSGPGLLGLWGMAHHWGDSGGAVFFFFFRHLPSTILFGPRCSSDRAFLPEFSSPRGK